MTQIFKNTAASCSLILIMCSGSVNADNNGNELNELLDIALTYFLDQSINQSTSYVASNELDRPQRGRSYSSHNSRYRDSYRNRDSYNKHSNRRGYGEESYTSKPIRGGGSSRRTRVVYNPYPNRSVSGITFSGMDHDIVHIKNVIAYPRKKLISHRGYSLSLNHPDRFLTTRDYIDYISIQAKRREYFTVTFHYD